MVLKIFHAYLYPFKLLTKKLPQIKEAGFNIVQISPIQPCKALWTDNGRIKPPSENEDFFSSEWYKAIYDQHWKLYQPLGFEIGNFLGTKKDFIELCEEAHKLGLQIIVDVVMRHLAGDDYGNLIPHQHCNHDIVNRKEFWMANQYVMSDNPNRHDEIYGSLRGLPTLDYNNRELQEEFYLPFLKEVLVYADGIRIDMCKHFSLPSEGGTFFTNVISKIASGKFIYGECIYEKPQYLEQYAKFVCPILENFEWWGHSAVRYFESHDTNLSFLRHDILGMQENHRLNEWENILRADKNAIGLYFPRNYPGKVEDGKGEDRTIFSDRMKQINNYYM